MPLLHQLQQLALAHHGVGQIQPREFDLTRLRRHRAVFDEPIVKRSMVFKLQRAQRVGDVFQRIFQRMREIVHRINAPGIAGVVMRRVHDAIQHRIAHVHVGRCHVDLCPQHALTLLELSTAHLFKQRKVLINRAVAVRGMRAGSREIAALDPHFFGRIVLHIGLTRFDQMNRAFMEKTEVIAREIKISAPVESQPTHVPLDAFDILGFLLFRVGIIKPQMAFRTA